jgi:hypothetical protein
MSIIIQSRAIQPNKYILASIRSLSRKFLPLYEDLIIRHGGIYNNISKQYARHYTSGMVDKINSHEDLTWTPVPFDAKNSNISFDL